MVNTSCYEKRVRTVPRSGCKAFADRIEFIFTIIYANYISVFVFIMFNNHDKFCYQRNQYNKNAAVKCIFMMAALILKLFGFLLPLLPSEAQQSFSV